MPFDNLGFLPPHQGTPVSGLHAYARQMGVAPGEAVELCVSNDGPVELTVLRYDGNTVADGRPVEALPRVQATRQVIHRGSYVYVTQGVGPLRRMAVEVWIRPLGAPPRPSSGEGFHPLPSQGTWSLPRFGAEGGGGALWRERQRATAPGAVPRGAGVGGPGATSGLIAQRGFALLLKPDGRVAFVVDRGGEGTYEISGPAVATCRWHHVVGCFGEGRLSLFLNGGRVVEREIDVKRLDGGGPLWLGAVPNARGEASGFLTGDLCAPGVYDRALTAEEVAARFAVKALYPAPGCVGHWRFDAVEGAPCRDLSPARRHGRPVNYPIRMIPGPRRTEDSDWSTYDPAQDPDFGHAIRFMADAIVDCRWPVVATWRVPETARSGQYGVRVTNTAGETRHLHFIVRPAAPSARLICLSTTNTRVAYNFRPFGERALDYGAYLTHASCPILGHLLGARRPATGEPWETTTVNFELPFYAWLEREGIPYDLYTEWDLERDPSLLDRYPVVAWAGHSEYWSTAQYESLRRFVRRGGHVLSLSGNTAYWRVSVDLENAVIEVRKHAREPTAGTTCDPAVHAAHHHQMDHRPGATMREAGLPEWAFLGVESNGYTIPPLDGPRAGYEVLAPDHWAFHTPRRIAIETPFAPGAAGYETDLSVRSMQAFFGPGRLPRYPFVETMGDDSTRIPDARRPAPDLDSSLTLLARARLSPAWVLDDDNRCFEGEMVSEMTITERPGEGIIFCAGSVLSSHILDQDINFGCFLRNVLDRMQ